MAKLLCTNNKQCDVRPANGKVFTLQELQRLVGGFIQVVPQPRWAQNTALWQHEVILVDEDGRIKQLPLNPAASELAEQMIYGDTLVLTMEEWRAGQGDQQDASDGQFATE